MVRHHFFNQYLGLEGHHPEVEKPGLAPGQDEGKEDEHHVVGDWVVVPLILKHLINKYICV